MDLKLLEEFFDSNLIKEDGSVIKENIISLNTITKNIKLYINIIKDSDLVTINLDPNLPEQALPLCEYQIKCDEFIFTTVEKAGSVLMFKYNGKINNNFTITKTPDGFSFSIGFQ